jgi:hypothetical protein
MANWYNLELFSNNNWWTRPEIARQLSGDTSFSTKSTRVPTYSFDVNANDQYIPSGYIGLDSKHHLTVSSTPTSTFNTNLAIANNKTGRLTSTVETGAIPDVPSKYDARLASYSVTDAEFNELMTEPDFVIPKLGLKVTTDGNGNVSSVGLSNTAVNLLSSYGPIALPNRAEITAGAVPKVDSSDSPYGTNTLKPIVPAKKPNSPLKSNTLLQKLNAVGKTPANNLLNKQNGLNPVEDRLQSLFSASQNRLNASLNKGLTISGQDSELNLEQVKQIAAVQGNFNVEFSAGFRQTQAQLASSKQAGQLQNSTTQPSLPLEVIMDGKVANMPETHSNPFARGFIRGDRMPEAISNLLDTTQKKSQGGYLYSELSHRPMNNGNPQQDLDMSSGNGGNGSYQQSDNSFTNNPEQQQEQQRRRNQARRNLSLSA